MQSHLNRKVALHLRWLTTEKFQNYETVKGGCIPSKIKFKTQRSSNLRWLAFDLNFKLPHTGCPIAHGIQQTLKLYYFYNYIPSLALSVVF